MLAPDDSKSDFVAPIKSKPNLRLLIIAIGLFVIWIGVLLGIISRS